MQLEHIMPTPAGSLQHWLKQVAAGQWLVNSAAEVYVYVSRLIADEWSQRTRFGSAAKSSEEWLPW